MKRMQLTLAATALLSLLGSGCILFQTGSANSEGSIGGREVFVGGTVFAWWDTTSYDIDNDGNLFKQTRDSEDQVLHVRLYGYSFNPNEDMRFWSWDRAVQFAYEVKRHDYVFFQVGEAGGLSNSARLEYNTDDPPSAGNGPYMKGSPTFNTAPVKINQGNEYPSTVKSAGTRVVTVLEIKKVERDAGKNIEGSFELKIEKSDSDPGNVVTGSVRGDFVAPVLNERIAECNFDSGGAGFGVDPCADLELDGENP